MQQNESGGQIDYAGLHFLASKEQQLKYLLFFPLPTTRISSR